MWVFRLYKRIEIDEFRVENSEILIKLKIFTFCQKKKEIERTSKMWIRTLGQVIWLYKYCFYGFNNHIIVVYILMLRMLKKWYMWTQYDFVVSVRFNKSKITSK